MLSSSTHSNPTLARQPNVLPKNMSKSGNAVKTNRFKCKNPHMVVHHNYHDHASDPVISKDTSEDYKAMGGVQIAFPVKLYQLLQSADEDNVSHIVR